MAACSSSRLSLQLPPPCLLLVLLAGKWSAVLCVLHARMHTIPVEQCDPSDAAANSACMDVCHYGGCRRGGECVSLGFGRGRGCHCKC
ncbi:hypothetical protein E2562_010637 [Oryza meyeriana var. granulata]|uniref:Uncharacterized protein n=1 Tax=Oryza meyeriana var. granulata TaxID=110450 RepID=A0A6G1EVV4_9ORYZ|nr:hypothetical protein E2562_010637 [Oryza meyeriana var. granulata]